MNKGITLLILGVVACAMGLVLFSHMQQEPGEAESEVSSALPALRNNATASRDLVEIVPPISSAPERAPVVTTPQGRPVADKPVAAAKPSTSSQSEVRKPPVEVQTPPQPFRQTPQAEVKPDAKPAAKPSEHTGKTAAQAQQTAEKPAPAKTKNEGSTETKPEAAEAQSPKMPDAPPVKTSGMPSLVPVDTLGTPAEAKAPAKAEPKKEQAEAEKTVAAPKSDVSSGTTGTHQMAAVTVRLVGSKVHVRLQADGAFAYKTMLLPGPDRLVIDLPGTWQNVKAPEVPQNRLLEKIRVGSQPAGPRMVLDLKTTPGKYEVVKVNDAVVEFVVE